MRQAASGRGSLAIARHLIDMVSDPIDLHRCILDGLGGAVGGLGRFVRGVERQCRGLFRARGGLLCSRGGRFGLGGLLLALRRASRDREDENQ